MKICPVKARLFLVDRQTDMMKLIVAFHNFVCAPNNIKVYSNYKALPTFYLIQGLFNGKPE